MQLGGVPNDLINNLNPITLVIFIPIVDFFIYPVLRKKHIRFTPIKRIVSITLAAQQYTQKLIDVSDMGFLHRLCCNDFLRRDPILHLSTVTLPTERSQQRRLLQSLHERLDPSRALLPRRLLRDLRLYYGP